MEPVVIREATRTEDLRAYLNDGVFRRVWSKLFLPAQVRVRWEPRFPELIRAA